METKEKLAQTDSLSSLDIEDIENIEKIANSVKKASARGKEDLAACVLIINGFYPRGFIGFALDLVRVNDQLKASLDRVSDRGN